MTSVIRRINCFMNTRYVDPFSLWADEDIGPYDMDDA